MLTRPFLLVMATGFFVLAALGALLPTLPRFAAGPLGAGDVGVGVVMGCASVVAVLAQPFAGRLGDARGRRLLLIGGASIVAAATLSYVLAETLAVLLPLRLASGVGEAVLLVGAATVVNDLAPDVRRGEALSYYTLSLYAGLAVGPLLGELALNRSGFDFVWILAGCLAVLGIACAVGVPETRPEGERVSGRRSFVHPAARGPGLVLLVAMLGFGGFNAFVALYALDVGLDNAAPLFALFALIVVGVRSVGARIPDRLGPERTARLALIGLAVGLALMGLWRTPVGLYVGTAAFAVGQSLAFPSLMMLTVRRAPASERGAAVGSFVMFVDLALGAGAIALGPVADAFGYAGVFLAASVASVVGYLLLLRLEPLVRARPSPG